MFNLLLLIYYFPAYHGHQHCNIADIIRINGGWVGIKYNKISQATGLFNTASVYAGIIVLALVGAIINALLKQVEARVLRWRGS